MRCVVQRVLRARVDVDGSAVAEMGAGLLALVGVGRGDDPQSARVLAEKLVALRVFPDEARERPMHRNLLEVEGTLGLVSQFTLHGDLRKGRRPSFGEAAPAEAAEPLFEVVVRHAQDLGAPVVTGRFGASMQVELVNDGPVTLLLDTAGRF